MKLEREFLQSMRNINGDGGREAKFEFLRKARACAKELSNPSIAQEFSKCLKKYGRPTVAVCLASTVLSRPDRLSPELVEWAKEVVKLWYNRPDNIDSVEICDGLHPTRIEDYSKLFVSSTIAE